MSKISIVLNGEAKQIPADSTVAELLGELGLDPTQVAVERNLDVVPKRYYTTAQLCAGDAVEVVTFVGGG